MANGVRGLKIAFIRACNLDRSDHVYIQCTASDHLTTFLVDTQADISIIKSSSINDFCIVDKTNVINIVGITDGFVPSLGSLQTALVPYPNGPEINAELSVVPSNFPIPVDGIIGKDFIKSYDCCLDYKTMSFSIRLGDKSIDVPIIDESFANPYHMIPPRCEVIKSFRLINNSAGDLVVSKQEVFPGLFIASAIVNPKNCFLRILNTNNRLVELKRVLRLNTDDLADFDIINVGSTNANRIPTLLNLISKNIPEHAPSSIKELCTSYADIFALPGDTHTVNNFYKQSLQLADISPVYVKNYRQPHSQKNRVLAESVTLPLIVLLPHIVIDHS